MPASRSDLPVGTITFVFTDIEGSTGLVNRLGDGYRDVLESHQVLLRAAFSARDGIEVSTEGDSFFVVFPSAPQAVVAAVDAQRALAKESWPGGIEMRVRMGLHSGEAVLGGDSYVGVDVHRAARIMSAAHGGQIVVSASTNELAGRGLPEGIQLRDLGEHRLRDLPEPERLYQVVAEGLRQEFPALRSLGARPNNLPTPLTTFVGRRRELDAVLDAVREARLVTLTGPGGAGKTRLSIQAAHALLPEFEDGAFFVQLAPITDASLVLPTIAEAIGLRESTDRPLLGQLTEHVADLQMLLVLDNLEQVVDAAGDIGQLLTSTRHLRIVTTSREPLGLQGEREFPVPPLGMPDPDHLPSFENLDQFEAVALFIERAMAVHPGFAVTNENAPSVAEICSRLDGLPLAIELAAARTKILSPQEILKRLGDRLGFLTSAGRDRPDRQQTLRNAIDWSHDLLNEDERRVFAALSVFSRGFLMEAAEAVCGGGGDVFELVASLVNKSLVRQVEGDTGESRFLMLETIRDFAAERLGERADRDQIQSGHAAYFLELAERAAPNLFGADQGHWLSLLAAEHNNFRAALAWTEGSGNVELALRLAARLWRFWQMRGHLREGAERLAGVLAISETKNYPDARADALEAAGGVAYWMVDMDAARRSYAECLELRRAIGEPGGIAEALYNLAFPYLNPTGEGEDVQKARELFDEALAIARTLDDEARVARILWGIGDLEYHLTHYAEAQPYLTEAMEAQRKLGDLFGLSWSLFLVGICELNLGREYEAEPHFRESLRLLSDAGDISGIALVVSGMAALAADRGENERAVRLSAAASAMEEQIGGGLSAANELREGWEDKRKELMRDEAEYQRLWELGAAMSAEEAVAYALAEESPPPEVP
jgi:predicted ATPase/class 3 adenylate cyclase